MQKRKTFVAIKSVDLSKLNKKLKENLSSEIDILKGLHHPHIVALIDCQESSTHIHLVMEYCALGDLSQFIKKRDTLGDHPSTRDMISKYPNPRVGGLNEVVVRHFLKQLASSLEFLRSKNLIHRDVKPQNLLLSPSPISFAKGAAEVEPHKGAEDSFTPLAGIESLPMLKIADFGFARCLPSTSLAETLCGSPLYMAPEILRYEKYDAIADLWSVGTVLYEMVVGKPPFRAANHVDLLRRIEQGGDKIKFPEGAEISDPMKGLIRKLLKRNPVERLSFKDFFNSDVIQGEIPGLVGEDRPAETPQLPSDAETKRTSHARRDSRPLEEKPGDGPYSSSPRDRGSPYETQKPESSRQPHGSSQRPGHARQTSSSDKRMSSDKDLQRAAVAARRPSIVTQTTAPGRQEQQDRNATAVAMERQRSRNTSSSNSPAVKERGHSRASSRDERERAAQDVAFERDYVVVEKRAVEVNAFADELAASPRLTSGNRDQSAPRNIGTVSRRATTQGTPTSTTGAQAPASSKAMQVATRSRADSSHQRQGSYERRYGPSPTSATSAISKAINLASGRLFGVGFSPPVARGGRSPPLSYNPFPAYPAAQGSLVVLNDAKTNAAQDEDTKTVQMIEECATRSDVVYGFAEVKYKQLIPLTPSTQPENAIKPAVPSPHDRENPGDGDEGLTADVIVTLSEEALVLYVKALSLLAKSMDIAGAWWARKNRGDATSDASSGTNPTTGNRVNNVVQWVRNRFNEVLEKAEFVRLKLIEGQKQLPTDHPSHPSNNTEYGLTGAAMGTSVDNVVITSGITAEKLMYDRALEMSRSAAINELTGEDLPGCELAYMTSISMLEAVLENEDISPRPEKKSGEKSDGDTDGVEVEDKEVLSKRKSIS